MSTGKAPLLGKSIYTTADAGGWLLFKRLNML